MRNKRANWVFFFMANLFCHVLETWLNENDMKYRLFHHTRRKNSTSNSYFIVRSDIVYSTFLRFTFSTGTPKSISLHWKNLHGFVDVFIREPRNFTVRISRRLEEHRALIFIFFLKSKTKLQHAVEIKSFVVYWRWKIRSSAPSRL